MALVEELLILVARLLCNSVQEHRENVTCSRFADADRVDTFRRIEERPNSSHRIDTVHWLLALCLVSPFLYSDIVSIARAF